MVSSKEGTGEEVTEKSNASSENYLERASTTIVVFSR